MQIEDQCMQTVISLGQPLLASSASVVAVVLKAIGEGLLDVGKLSLVTLKDTGTLAMQLPHASVFSKLDGLGSKGLISYAQLGEKYDDIVWVEMPMKDAALRDLRDYCLQHDIAFACMQSPGLANKAIAFSSLNTNEGLEHKLRSILCDYAQDELKIDPEVLNEFFLKDELRIDNFEDSKNLGDYTWSKLDSSEALALNIISSENDPLVPAAITHIQDDNGCELAGIAYEDGTFDIYRKEQDGSITPLVNELEAKPCLGENLSGAMLLAMSQLDSKRHPQQESREIAKKQLPSLMESKQQIDRALNGLDEEIPVRKQQLSHRF